MKPDRKRDLIEDADRHYYYWTKQKKRPALPETRAALLQLAREQRQRDYADYTREDGLPLTAEDRLHIRHAQREGYLAGRAYIIEMENEIERRFWQMLAGWGLYPEGGRQ